MNPTERYFALFEAWLVRGNPEILGERGFSGNGGIQGWMRFFPRVPDRGLQIANSKDAEMSLRYTPTLCTLALLERVDPRNKKLKRAELREFHGEPPPQYGVGYDEE